MKLMLETEYMESKAKLVFGLILNTIALIIAKIDWVSMNEVFSSKQHEVVQTILQDLLIVISIVWTLIQIAKHYKLNPSFNPFPKIAAWVANHKNMLAYTAVFLVALVLWALSKIQVNDFLTACGFLSGLGFFQKLQQSRKAKRNAKKDLDAQ